MIYLASYIPELRDARKGGQQCGENRSRMGMGDGRESSIHIDIKWDRGAVTEMFSNCQLPVSCNRE